MGTIEASKAFIYVEAKDRTGNVLDKAFKKVTGFVDNIEKQIAGKLTSSFKGLTSLSSLIVKSFTSVGSTVINVFQKIGSAAKAYITDSMEVFKGFDDTLLLLKAVTPGTEAEYQRLRNQAKELGRATQFTAKQAGEMQVELGKAGFARPEIEKMTKSVLNLSAATATAAETSSSILAATMRQFELEAEQSARVADTLTAAANGSFNSVTDLGEALRYSGRVSKDFNMSLEDTLGILMMLGNLDIRGSLAGTGLRNMLTFISSKQEELKDLLGVDAADKKTGNLKPIKDLMKEIDRAMSKMGTAEKADIFAKLFGMRALVPAKALASGSEGVSDFVTQLENAAGTADSARQLMESGWGGAVRSLESAIEGLKIGLGELLAPMMIVGSKGLAVINIGLATMLEKRDGILDFFKQGGGLAGVFVRQLIQWSNSILEFFRPVQEIASTVVTTFQGITDALSQDDFQGAFDVAIAGMETVWLQFKNYVLNVWGDISTGILTTWEYISAQIKISIEDIVTKLRSSFSSALLDMAGGLSKLSTEQGAIKGAFSATLGQMLQKAGISVGLSDSDVVGSEAAKKVYKEDSDKRIAQLIAQNEKDRIERELSTRLQERYFEKLANKEATERKLAEEQGNVMNLAQFAFESIVQEIKASAEDMRIASREKQETDFAISTTLPEALERGTIEAARASWAMDQQQLINHLVDSGKMTAKNTKTTNDILSDIKDDLALGVP